ncbi:MAG: LTA synthase family protein, partial [Lachnospiraceae bacterium]
MKNKGKKIAKAMLAFIVPVAIFYLFEWYTHNPWEDIRWDIQVLNIVFFELVMVLLYSLIGRLHIALLLETVVFMVYGLVNYFVLAFRSQPIQPWDFFSIGTAASVAGDFNYVLSKQAAIVLAGFLALIAVELLFCRNRLKHTLLRFYNGPLKSWAFRGPAATGALALLVFFVSLLHNEDFVQQEIKMYDKLFTPTVMSERDGTAVAFLLELQYIAVDKPEGYDREEVEAFFSTEALSEAVNPASDEQTLSDSQVSDDLGPNIIVIMDEAFADLAVLGDFETNEDYMPFLHSLQEDGENAITGNLHVSIKGGNTANTEFEFLTGHTMAFLPQGSIPYQQYINEEQMSIVSYLRGQGYSTRAAHPYYASGWERETVYPLLGFEQADFIDSFTNAVKLRKYVSDASAFDYIIRSYEEKEPGEPLFFFEVTMQNHSGYSEEFDNFTPDIIVEGSTSTSLNQYLSLVKRTDEALEELITYFEEQDEDTIIVFFGDHQPADSVVEPIWRLQ